MAIYGVTEAGFVKKPYDEILEDVKQRMRNLLGNVNTSEDAVFGILAAIEAKSEADEWDVLEADYYSCYPNSAVGTSLDNVCELNIIRRLGARAAIATVSCQGLSGVDILVGSIFATSDTHYNFISQYLVTIGLDNTNYFTVEVDIVVDDTNYIVTANGRNAVINSGTGATKETIATALFNEINALTLTLGIYAELVDVVNGILDIWSNDKSTAVVASVSSNLSITDFWTPVRCISQDVGAQITANTGTITDIIAAPGVSSANNFTDATPGRDRETDAELRERRFESVRITGGGTLGAIVARVRQNVSGVTYATGIVNNENEIDPVTLLPPHSFEIIVAGGDNIDIANTILSAKSAGIQAYGDIVEIVNDPEGNPEAIGFSRPVDVYIWVKLTLTVTSDFPSSGIIQIIDNIVLWAQGLGIGDDVLIQELNCPIYEVAGITNVDIELAKTYTTAPPGGYVTTNIDIAADELAIFDSTRIEITIP